MSLNYDLGRIKDWKKVCVDSEGRQSVVTKDIIFTTMAVDLGSITEKNYFEFHRRMLLFGVAVGSDYSEITLADIKAHIGLSVNVTTLTRKQWLKKLDRVMEREEHEYFYKLNLKEANRG